jgi:hypothetical protein
MSSETIAYLMNVDVGYIFYMSNSSDPDDFKISVTKSPHCSVGDSDEWEIKYAIKVSNLWQKKQALGEILGGLCKNHSLETVKLLFDLMDGEEIDIV